MPERSNYENSAYFYTDSFIEEDELLEVPIEFRRFDTWLTWDNLGMRMLGRHRPDMTTVTSTERDHGVRVRSPIRTSISSSMAGTTIGRSTLLHRRSPCSRRW